MSITVSPLQGQGNPSQRRAFRQSRPSPSPVVRRFFSIFPPFQPCLSQICHKSRIQSRLLPQYQPAGKFVQFSLSRIYLESQTVPQKSLMGHPCFDHGTISTFGSHTATSPFSLHQVAALPSFGFQALPVSLLSRSEMTKPYQAYIYTTRATTV